MEEGLHVSFIRISSRIPAVKPTFSDYRGLKKCITAIRRAQEQNENSSFPLPATPALVMEEVQTQWRHHDGADQPTLSPGASLTDVAEEGYERDNETEHDVGAHTAKRVCLGALEPPTVPYVPAGSIPRHG